MRIDRVVLNNFGSYEGETIITTNSESGKNIILIGGKNGAGKTTLFTAMRVCLYGYMSMGYKNFNAYYTRAITKLINNKAKMVKPSNAYVSMSISLSNGQDLDHYELKRAWELGSSLTENFTITRNSRILSAGEIADFEKYLLSLIPPELFNLYFFDGEKIADFFMNEGSNARIKDAFLILCGYDTFDIMRRNFKRVSNDSSASSSALGEYLSAKEIAETERRKYQALIADVASCVEQIQTCESDIAALDKDYSQKGGISQDEWNMKLVRLREEEKKRDVWNAILRKWANDLIPFLMIRKQIVEVKYQITKENNSQKYKNFCEILDIPEIRTLLDNQIGSIKEIAFSRYGGSETRILDLSLEQSTALLAQISTIMSFDIQKIAKYKQAVKKSVAFSAELRQELDNSSISAVQEYVAQRTELLERKNLLLSQQVELEQLVTALKESVQLAESNFSKAQMRLESELKKASINDISAKAIIMLDKLQKILYRQQITKVEDFFRAEIKTLMRKTNFIDDIKIDDDFNIALYRHDAISTKFLLEVLSEKSESRFVDVFGHAALYELQRLAENKSLESLILYCTGINSESIVLPLRIDQASLSNGEKQIFIMALYHALVQLGHHEIPFIIDTPFARIDTEHRRNISNYFFSKLHGQVFILSTNEEINSDDVQIMRDKIAATYMLENTDNKRTIVLQNSYFRR